MTASSGDLALLAVRIETELSALRRDMQQAEGTVKRQLHAAVHRLRRVLSAANVAVGGRA